METSRDSTLSLIFDVGVPLVIDSNLIQISDAEERVAVSLILAATPGMIAPFVAARGARVGKEALFLMARFRDSHQLKGESRSRPRVSLLLGIICGACSGVCPRCKRRDGETLIRRMLRRDQ